MTGSLDSVEDIRDYAIGFLDVEEDQVMVLEDGFEVKVKLEGVGPMKARDLEKDLERHTNSVASIDVQVMMPPPSSGDSEEIDEETVDSVLESSEEVEMVVGGDTPSHPNCRSDFSKVEATDFQIDTPDISTEKMEKAISQSMENIAEQMAEAMEGIPRAISQAGEAMTKMAAQMPPPEEVQRVCDELGIGADALDAGDRVRVEMTDGSKLTGTIKGELSKPAGRFHPKYADGGTLADYWREKGYDIESDEAVFEVECGNGVLDFPESKVRLDLTDISGVGSNKADALRAAGFEEKVDVMKASQSELASVEGIGNALAARIKADVGDMPEELRVDSDGVEPPDDVPMEDCPECGDDFPVNGAGAIEGDGGELFCSLTCLQDHYA